MPKLNQNEIQAQLAEQLEILENHIAQYDDGKYAYAKEIATKIRVLVHDTKHSKSLLYLSDQKSILFLDTNNTYSPTNLVSHLGLISMCLIRNGNTLEYKYLARCVTDFAKPIDEYQIIPFSKWWEEDIVLSDHQKNTYTRKDLVLYIANKDGGAHVDEEVSLNQYLLSKGKPTFEYIPSSSEELIEKTKEYLSSVRQIGFELVQSLKIHTIV